MFQKLLQHFSSRDKLPVEVTEISDFLVSAGCQDSIILHPENMEAGELRGTFYQYTTHPGVYASPEFVTLIVYPKNEDLSYQRVICGKEMIHLCDSKRARTNTPDEVDALIEKLLGPLSTEDYGLADLMASVDRLALYQALAILFPISARNVALEKMANGSATLESISQWSVLPEGLVSLILSEDWLEVHAVIEQM